MEVSKELMRGDLGGLQTQSKTIQTLNNETTIYKGELTKHGVAKQIAKITAVFPKISDAQLNILRGRIKDKEFTDKRFEDAVNNVIDNYEGWDKTPNLANFLSYDKKVRLFTWNEAIEFGMQDLDAINIGIDRPRWAKKEDVKRFSLAKWVKN